MALQNASIKDFSGGLNVADDPFKLTSKYLVQSDNIIVGSDNDATVRFGYKFLVDMEEGYEEDPYTDEITFTFTTANSSVSFTDPTATAIDGGHVVISGFDDDTLYNGVLGSELNGLHNIHVVGSVVYFNVRTPANASSNVVQATTVTFNNKTIDGEIADLIFFQGFIHVFAKTGVVATYDLNTNTKDIIWNASIASQSVSNPAGWRRYDTVDFATFKQTLIVVNGRHNDKPLEINHNRIAGNIAQYLVDPSTVSNANVYAADFVTSFGGYLILGNPNNTSTPSTLSPTILDVSAYATSGVFTGNPAPEDATQVDIGIMADTIDPRIRGFGKIRDKLFVAFNDTGMLGTVGSYDSTGNHRPNFNDQIPQHGSLNNRVIHTIGNDIFMCDYAGVPAFSLSTQSAVIVPERLSMFIDPMLNAHLARLSDKTKDEDVWAIYSTRDRQYMLFLPKFDDFSAFRGDNNGIYITDALRQLGRVIVGAHSHTVSNGDFVDISGCTDIEGLSASDVNGRRKVMGVVNKDYFIIQVGSNPITAEVSGGGNSIEIKPVNDEVISYVFHYHPQAKIRRWTRFRGLTFTCGCITNNGRLIFSKDGKLYQFGTSDAPLYGDEIGEYDSIWETGATYSIGHRVAISSEATDIYECIVEHVSSGNFDDDVINSNNWQPYEGRKVSFSMETPWSELKHRNRIKFNRFLQVDASGRGLFSVDAFVDKLTHDKEVLEGTPSTAFLFPNISVELAAQDLGGFGSGNQPYGGGNNTITRKMFDYPFMGKQIKIRVHGATADEFKLTAVHMMYNLGGYWG